MLSSVLVLVQILFVSGVELLAQTQGQFVGCVSQISGGGLQFQARPSGNTYLLQGDNLVLTQHVNQMVRMSASPVSSGNGTRRAPALLVQTIDLISRSCTSGLPPETPVSVAGKVGEGQVAVPMTTTASSGQTTPGFQTEAITDQEPPTSGRSPESSTRSEVYSPLNTA